ncbi:MAG TPA: radical SAM protein [Vicinamibacterales bacterium]|jgi:MoaA/NifB/PqqE/SkfB family radical SAM enzyme|nr:radical SAM protein [Vicinamibacterales bacterium]
MRGVYALLRLNAVLRGHRSKFVAAYLAHTCGLRHLAIRFDPVMACNLRCRMCYFSNDEWVRRAKVKGGAFSASELERLAAMFFPKSLLVVFGCGTEPTLYRDYPELVRLAKRHRVPNVSLTTNAQLLDADAVERLIDYHLDELTVSVHGTVRDTYERFMTGASFDRLHRSLTILEDAKRRRRVQVPALRINYTVNEENLDELGRFFDEFGGYSVSILQVRPVMDFNGAYRRMLAGSHLERYRRTISALGEQCARRGITYLANTVDPAYQAQNDRGVILQAVQRNISPVRVWREDFDWRAETYDEFCRRIGWSAHLLRCATAPLDRVVHQRVGLTETYSARYDVNL